MKPDVIDSLYSTAANEGVEGFRIKGAWEPIDALGNLLKPLNLDFDTSEAIMQTAMELASAGQEEGFRTGFRLGVRLMQECAPERGERRDAQNAAGRDLYARLYKLLARLGPRELEELVTRCEEEQNAKEKWRYLYGERDEREEV